MLALILENQSAYIVECLRKIIIIIIIIIRKMLTNAFRALVKNPVKESFYRIRKKKQKKQLMF